MSVHGNWLSVMQINDNLFILSSTNGTLFLTFSIAHNAGKYPRLSPRSIHKTATVQSLMILAQFYKKLSNGSPKLLLNSTLFDIIYINRQTYCFFKLLSILILSIIYLPILWIKPSLTLVKFVLPWVLVRLSLFTCVNQSFVFLLWTAYSYPLPIFL